MKNNYAELIASTEAAYDMRVKEVADRMLSCGSRILLIAGGSCVGKTPTTIKLDKYLTDAGRNVHSISLDDFYRFGDECVYLPDGTKDIESINSLRLDLITKMMRDIAENKPVLSLPRFDFTVKERTDDAIKIERTDNDLFIIEGLHAHNPLIADAADSAYRLYLYTKREGCDFNPRLVRRIVRDSIYRASPARCTIDQWHNVIAEEEKSIIPFADNADDSINTYFAYERGLFVDLTLKMLDDMPPVAEYDDEKAMIRDYLCGAESIPSEAVPPNSLMKEFV